MLSALCTLLMTFACLGNPAAVMAEDSQEEFTQELTPRQDGENTFDQDETTDEDLFENIDSMTSEEEGDADAEDFETDGIFEEEENEIPPADADTDDESETIQEVYAQKRNLTEAGLLSLSMEQDEEIIRLHLDYASDYVWQAGDWFELLLPEDADLSVLGETLIGAESGFRTQKTEVGLLVFLVDEASQPRELNLVLFNLSEELKDPNERIWTYACDEQGPKQIVLDFSWQNGIERRSFNYPEAIKTFNLNASQMGALIKSADEYSWSGWELIKSAYGASGQQKVLDEVKRILTTKGITSLDSRSLVEISDKGQCLKIINNYLVNKVSYDINKIKTSKERGQTAYSALIDKKTVCAGYSHAFSLLANALEIRTLMVVGKAKGGSDWGGHAWNISLLGNYYYVTDVTFNDPIGVPNGSMSTRYLLLGSDAINKDHRVSADETAPGSKLYRSRLAAGNYSPVRSITAKLGSRALSNNQTVSVDVGKTISIDLGVSGGSKYSLTWTTSDSSIASVNASYQSSAILKITGKKNGTATIRIYSPNKLQMSLKVSVVNSTFTIRYYANGGSGTMKDTVVKYGTDTKTTPNAFTKTGYLFQYWHVQRADGSWVCAKKNASGQEEFKSFKSLDDAKKEGYAIKPYSNGTTVSKTSSIHGEVISFIAQWKPITFTIGYRANGGSGSMPETSVIYGVNTATLKNTFTRPGYVFSHWFVLHDDGSWVCTKKDAQGNLIWKNFLNLDQAKKEGFAPHPYANGTTVSKTSIKDRELVRFIAQWTKLPDSSQPSEPETESVIMHRLYNPNSGEHFYTANTKEKDYLFKVGWKYEGKGWTAPKSSKTPVYRLYNPNSGDHHYTKEVKEKNALTTLGWKYEGIGWYSDDARRVALYRQYNPNAKSGSHNYTVDKKENDALVKMGWKEEGIGWYGL